MSMSKEEIALQLAIARINDLQPTKGCSMSPSEGNKEFNEKLGCEIANLYNSILNNLDCYKSKNIIENDNDNSNNIPII